MSWLDSVKTYGGYALDPVGIATGKKASWAPDPLGLSQDPSLAPQIKDVGYGDFLQTLKTQPTQTPEQTAYLNNLASAVYGNGPSAAQSMLNGVTSDAQRSALGNSAAGVSGGNAALALRNGVNAAAQAGQQGGAQVATLRAQEVANARSQLGSAIGQQMQGQQFNTNAQLQALNGLQNLSNTNAALQQQQVAGAQNKLGSIGGTVLGRLSDERAKDDVHPEHPAAIEEFLRSIQPVGYRYKGSAEPEHGVIAQDVEQGGPIGKGIVVDMGGLKGIDLPRAVGALMQAVAHVNRKVDARG